MLAVPHAPDCWAVKNVANGTWWTPWAFLADREAPVIYGTVTGNLNAKRLNTRWLRFICNCTHCPARLLVNENSVLETFGNVSAQ